VSLFSAGETSELTRFWREMTPVPGRMDACLRFALSTALATLAMLILQARPAYIATGLYFLFFASYDTPFDCFNSLLKGMVGAAVGTTSATLLIIASGNHPVARVVGLAVFTFLATFFFRTSVVPVAALMFGVFTFNTISLWERHLRAEAILHTSLWSVATLPVAAFCAVAVEYLFNRRDPLIAWRREIKARCAALEQLFLLCARHADAEQLEKQSAVVRRYAVTGEGQMNLLLESISKRETCGSAELGKFRTVTLMIDRLLVFGAGFAEHNDLQALDPVRLERISRAIVAIGEGRVESIKEMLGDVPTALANDLDHIEQTLQHVVQPTEQSAEDSITRPCHRWWEAPFRNFFVPDVLTNETYYIYALKVSLCATICYVIYQGIGWLGAYNCFYTVLFTALSTTGATNRKLLFRFIGSAIGGLILGIGCMVWVFPNIEWVSSFLLVIAGVAFIALWVGSSSYFGYIGLQIAFSFYLLAFERVSAPDQMTPARDRLDGIAIGLLVMFFIFHQVRPERTVDTMRRLLARLLRTEAELLRVLLLQTQDVARSAKIAQLRSQIESMAANLRSFADVVKYEFEPDRAASMRLSDEILDAATSAADLLICIRAWPQHMDGGQESERLREIRNTLEYGMRNLACSLESEQEASQEPITALEDLRSMVPIRITKAIDSYLELQMACDGIVRSAT